MNVYFNIFASTILSRPLSLPFIKRLSVEFLEKVCFFMVNYGKTSPVFNIVPGKKMKKLMKFRILRCMRYQDFAMH